MGQLSYCISRFSPTHGSEKSRECLAKSALSIDAPEKEMEATWVPKKRGYRKTFWRPLSQYASKLPVGDGRKLLEQAAFDLERLGIEPRFDW